MITLGRVYQVFYTDREGKKHLAGVPQKTYDDALELVRNAQTLQSAIFGDATIQWPTYIAEIAVHPLTQYPIQATQITEVPWP